MERLIHTGLYSDKAKVIFENFHYELSNMSSKMIRRAQCISSIVVAPDAEICLNINSDTHRTPFYRRNDNEVREWIAWIIKQRVKQELEANTGMENILWSRCNITTKSEVFSEHWNPNPKFKFVRELNPNGISVTISDLYLVYDLLKSRKNIENKYQKTQIKEMLGIQRDPIQTELEIAKREQIKEINNRYNILIKDADPNNYTSKAYAQRKTLIKAFDTECNKKIEELKAQRDKELQDLEDSLRIAV